MPSRVNGEICGWHCRQPSIRKAQKDSGAPNLVWPRDEEEAKKGADEALFLSLLSDLEADLQDTRQRREGYEQELVDEYGEDFVVDMAERFLDPEIVQRLPGESEQQYRERLEQELEELMLNPDGSIKAGYEDMTIALWLHEKFEEERLEAQISTLHDLDAEIAQREALGLDVTEQRAEIAQMAFEAQAAAVDDGAGAHVREEAVASIEESLDENGARNLVAGMDALFPTR